MKFIIKLKEILLHPVNCWSSISKEQGIEEAFKYLAVLAIIPLAILFIIGIVQGGTLLSNLNIILLISYPTIILVTFIEAGLLHILVKLLKGKGDLYETCKAVIYSSTPYLPLFLFPNIISFLGSIYSFFLLVTGISKLHKIKVGHVIGAFIVTIILLVVLSFILFILWPNIWYAIYA